MVKFTRLNLLLFSLLAITITLIAALLPGNATPPSAWIAFVSSRDGNTDIYRMRLNGTQQQRLTTTPENDEGPQWSPDGQWIAFASNRDGNYEIYRMRADGTNQ